MLLTLPLEMIEYIFKYLDYREIESLKCTCKYLNELKYEISTYVPLYLYNSLKNKYKIKKISHVISTYKIPNEIEEVCFGRHFDETIEMSNSNIKRLTLNDNYNYPILELPHKLTYLTFNWKFNQIITNYPNKLVYLKFGWDYNQTIYNLPKTLKYLIFGFNYNTPVCDLPDSLIYLEFGFNYNHYIEKWPKNLKYLKFGWEFNQPLLNLPLMLEYIKHGNNFDNLIEEPNNYIKIKHYRVYNE